MVEEDLEVEQILKEIRLRVQNEQQSISQDAMRTSQNKRNSSNLNPAYGASATLQKNLAITKRTQNNLPPLVSQRSGATARLELWVKRQIKRITKWFVYDQLSFNSATHELLSELDHRQSSHEHKLVETNRRQSRQEEKLTEIDKFQIAHRQLLSEMQKQTDLFAGMAEDWQERFLTLENKRSDESSQLKDEIRELKNEIRALKDETRKRFGHPADEQEIVYKKPAAGK